jgi:hypothetical protein
MFVIEFPLGFGTRLLNLTIYNNAERSIQLKSGLIRRKAALAQKAG